MSTKESSENPRLDISNVTVSAFNSIREEERKTKTNLRLLGRDDNTSYTSPKFKTKVRAWTKTDNQSHTYFHSLSIDVNVEDFMGTAELKCPYDSDLMEYWTPITQDVVIYGSNRGPEKILFIGRVRGVKQDGYELVIEFQNYGWKFKQLVTQSYANDNVLNKDGYTIMRLMFEALKIDSWVISDAAKARLKQVGINKDGNLTVNGKEVKKIPDLLKRLQASDPSKYVNKNTLNNKLREKYLHNIDNINYTLKYEKPTPVMKKISSQGSYSSGKNVYSNPYGSASGGGSGSSKTSGNIGAGVGSTKGDCYTLDVSKHCRQVTNQTMIKCMQKISAFNRNCAKTISPCWQEVENYAKGPNTKLYSTGVSPCLYTISKNYRRTDGNNIAKRLYEYANKLAIQAQSKNSNNYLRDINNMASNVSKGVNYALSKSLGGSGNLIQDANWWINRGKNFFGFK